jgi:hypothetical protein
VMASSTSTSTAMLSTSTNEGRCLSGRLESDESQSNCRSLMELP